MLLTKLTMFSIALLLRLSGVQTTLPHLQEFETENYEKRYGTSIKDPPVYDFMKIFLSIGLLTKTVCRIHM